MIFDAIGQMRRAPVWRLDDIHDAMRRAGTHYVDATVCGLTPEAYVQLTCQVTGLPFGVVEASVSEIGTALTAMRDVLAAATPAGTVWNLDDARARSGCGLFSRRGDVLTVLAAGNGPGVHALWPQAVAMGYRVLVRPSTREPFTPQRVVASLTAAGLGDYVALIPTDHRGADAMVEAADLSLVYGGADVVARYGDNPRVLVQGPGRSKVLIGADADLDQAVDVTARSVLALGGVACVSTSAVLVEGDVSEFARRLTSAFDAVVRDPAVAGRILPTAPAATFERLRVALGDDDYGADLAKVSGLGPDPDTVCGDAARGGGLLPPHITVVATASDPRVQREFLPCVTVAPFDRARDHAALSGSLVLTVLSADPELINLVLADPTVANVYVGAVPTTWMAPTVPHDGYLSDFLMRNRGVLIADALSATSAVVARGPQKQEVSTP
jgi:acyl-CoA reductase-like NAD-dependent aldehyde dehydrogenase